MLKKTVFSITVFSLLFSCAHRIQTSDSVNPLEYAIEFYQGPLNHLSCVRNSECPMYPSCSQYSIEAVKKYGTVIGWIMTCDRLMRCGRDELRISPQVFINGKQKCYDP